MKHHANAIIESLGVYLPPQALSTAEVLAACQTPIRFPLEKVTGIKNRRVAGQQEFSIDLARQAIADCLAKSQYQPADIELLVCCNISRYDGPKTVAFEPSTASKLRQHFGFSRALAFDLTNACAGMFTGIYLVNALIQSGAIRCGLVVSGEYITHLTQVAQREIASFMDARLPCLTLGDAGAALILAPAPEGGSGFQEIDLQTFGRYSPYCVARASENGGMIMLTDSVNLTDVALKAGAKHALNTLQQADWPPDSFQQLIMHQTSATTLNSARREINRLLESDIFHDGNTVNNLEQRGNTASTSHFIAIADRIYSGQLNAGDKVVFSISASGLTLGTALYVFDDLPERMRLRGATPKETPRQPLSAPVPARVPGIRIESVGTIPEAASGERDSMPLLRRAAGHCLQRSAHPAEDIGLLLYCGVYRTDYVLEPAYAALLAGELDINATISAPDHQKTLAFDIFNGALGFLNACYVAQQMIAVGKCTAAMIVAAESENNAAWFPEELVGVRETASAIILDAHPLAGRGFSRFHFRYHTERLDAYTTSCNLREVKPRLQVEKADELEALYLACILPAVQELLGLEGLDLDQVDRVFPPQISSGFIARLSEALGLPLERFVDVAGEGPDWFSSSLPYALDEALAKGLVQDGDIALIIAVGSGIQAGGAIYYF